MISSKTAVSAIALLLVSAGAASAFVATATTDLNVRRGPGTNHSVVDVLQPGQAVEVVGQAGGWYELASGGWASGNYLDPQDGQQTVVIDRGGYDDGYGYDYGPVAFYYDDDPFYWDNAGFYFAIRDGRRHRIGWDWFDRHDHDDFRWADRRHRSDFDYRWRRFARGGGDNDRGIFGSDDGERRGGILGNREDDDNRGGILGSRDDDDGDRMTRDGGIDDGMQSGRASAVEAEDSAGGGSEIDRGGAEVRGGGEGNLRASGSGSEGAPQRFEENLPGGGY